MMKKYFVAVLLLFVQHPSFAQNASFSAIQRVEMTPADEVCQLHITQDDLGTYLPPPGGIGQVLSGGTSTINVTYNDEDPMEPWPQEAIDAFEFAANIWASHIDSPAPIEVEAEWSDLGGCDLMSGVTLGSAGPSFGVTFGGSPIPNTVYPIGLFNALAGSDQFPSNSDISASFNRACDDMGSELWYFGTDGNTPAGKIDFVTVVLHELGHGLGFTGSAKVDDGAGGVECDGVSGNGCFNGTPNTFDRFTFDASTTGTSLLDTNTYPNNSATLGSVLTGSSVYFDATATTAANAGTAPPLYSPGSWQSGSSFSHLDESSYNGSPHALMTPSISTMEANHSPGALTCGIFQDMGWPMGADCLSLLPVELSAFDVLVNGEVVALRWVTESEQNNAGFEIEIAPETGPFKTVAFVPGMGTASIRHTYRYDWPAPDPGRYQIRLKQIDFDGGFAYSDVLEALVSLREPARINGPFPNPFNPVTQFEVIVAQDQHVRIGVFDATGREVATLFEEVLSGGQQRTFTFDATSLPSGTYWVRIRGDRFEASRSILLLK